MTFESDFHALHDRLVFAGSFTRGAGRRRGRRRGQWGSGGGCRVERRVSASALRLAASAGWNHSSASAQVRCDSGHATQRHLSVSQVRLLDGERQRHHRRLETFLSSRQLVLTHCVGIGLQKSRDAVQNNGSYVWEATLDQILIGTGRPLARKHSASYADAQRNARVSRDWFKRHVTTVHRPNHCARNTFAH